MKRWQSVVLAIQTMLVVGALTACVSAPTQPNGLTFPPVNRPQLLAPVFDSTKILDCLSAELQNAGADKRKLPIFLAELPNTVGQKVGKIDLPISLRPFVRMAFDRVSSGFSVVSVEDQTPFKLTGSLYAAAPFRVLENEFEALGLGLGSSVEATDVSIQLFWDVRLEGPNAKGHVQSGTSVTVNLRLYSAEQGASAFLIKGGANGLVLARSRASQAASPNLALQSAVNVAVASLIRALAARQWDSFVSSCDFGAEENLAIPADTAEPPVMLPLDVSLAMSNDRLCAKIQFRNQKSPILGSQEFWANRMKLEIAEFRGEGIEVRRKTIDVDSPNQIVKMKKLICIPKGAFDGRSEEARYLFKTSDGRPLGANRFFFQ